MASWGHDSGLLEVEERVPILAPTTGQPVEDRLSRREVAEVYRRTGALVLRRCRLLLRDGDAEDALQEVFIRLMRYGRFAGADQVPLAWLYRTAERCCFDRMRKRVREPAGLSPEMLDSLAIPGGGPRAEARELLTRFFHRLDDKLKQVALLHFVDGLPQERIALQLGWSRRTVGKKLEVLRQRAARLNRGGGGP